MSCFSHCNNQFATKCTWIQVSIFRIKHGEIDEFYEHLPQHLQKQGLNNLLKQ